MKPEKRHLIHDVLDDPAGEALRAATLSAGRRVLRHKRWRRAATRAFALAVVAGVALMSLHLRTKRPPPSMAAVTPPAAKVNYLSDDQLLALFPNTPVALATVGDRKVLIFPRPGDQERFVARY